MTVSFYITTKNYPYLRHLSLISLKHSLFSLHLSDEPQRCFSRFSIKAYDAHDIHATILHEIGDI
jgi:hypothetical protein